MKSFLLFAILTLSSIQISYCQFMNGMSRYFETPNGNTICDKHEVSNCINAPVGELSKWYFYKDRIIGIYTAGYFILNEVNPQDSLYITQSESQWNNQIKTKNLEPSIWTKWYTMDDGEDDTEGHSEFAKHFLFYCFTIFILCVSFISYFISSVSSDGANKKILVYPFAVFAGLRVLMFFWSIIGGFTNSF